MNYADDIVDKQKIIDNYLNKRGLLGFKKDYFGICVETESEHYGKISLLRINNDTLEKYTVPEFVEIIGGIEGLKYINNDNTEPILVICSTSVSTVGGKLREITIGKNVEIISSNAFKMSDIETVRINGGIKEIGNSAFANCTELKYFDFNKLVDTNINKYAFMDCSKLTTVDLKNVIKIDRGAFCRCSSITELHLSNKLEVIGDCCFMDCVNLTKVEIPDSVDEIKYKAFFNTISMSELYIGKNLYTMGMQSIDIKSDSYRKNKLNIILKCDLRHSRITREIIYSSDTKVECNEINASLLINNGLNRKRITMNDKL